MQRLPGTGSRERPLSGYGARRVLPCANLYTARQAVVPVMKDCKEIETCLECSAEKLVFVGEVFYYALKAVVHPTGPLFDATAQGGQGALTPLCVKALKRIFLMCDLDRVCSPCSMHQRPGLPLATVVQTLCAFSARDTASVWGCLLA